MTIGTGIFSSTVLLIIVFAFWQATKHRKWKAIGKVSLVLTGLGTVVGVGLWGWSEYTQRPVPQAGLDGIVLGMTPIDLQIQKGKPHRTLEIPAPPLGFKLDETQPKWASAPIVKKSDRITLDEALDQRSRGPWEEYQKSANGSSSNPFDQFDPPTPKLDNGGEKNGPTLRWLFEDGDYTDALTDVIFDLKDGAMRVSVVCRRHGYENLFGLSRGTHDKDVLEKLGEPTSVSIRGDGTAKMVSYEQWNVAFEVAKGQVIAVCVADHALRYSSEWGDSASTG